MRKLFPIVLLIIYEVAFFCTSVPLADEPTQSNAAPSHSKKYNFSTDWFTRDIPIWDKTLQPLKGQPYLHYLEVGVFEGRSFIWVLENILTHPTCEATAVDIFPAGLKERFLVNIKQSGSENKVTVLTGESQIVLRDLPHESFDIIYIDGSHRADDVLIDAVLSWRLLKDGGFIIFDDYHW
ncbi:MAG: class I SAM-dependent methyltransferase, partial [Candidatus Omnitrophica bacterium]|nr:class I SAM-dependent methyltransferase [Candidatus Omnitrophota bacterium]